jgi:hypothetical protein
MVSEVTDSEFNPVVTQPVSGRRGRVSCQGPDLMSLGQQRLDDGAALLTGSTGDEHKL